MVFKLQKKVFGIECAVDICEYVNQVLQVKGWMFSHKYQIKDVKVLIVSDGGDYSVGISTGVNRSDVYQELQVENAKRSGFYGKILVENIEKFEIWLVLKVKGTVCKYKIGEFEADGPIEKPESVNVQRIDTKSQEIDIVKFIQNTQDIAWTFREKFYEETVDIILPIYNGYQFFERLFSTIELTKIKYRLIIINDNSPDERISPYLRHYAENNRNVVLIENDKNLGFVKNVNKGLKLAEGHVALVNSDVEFPSMWLERLMLPILCMQDIASATPYTNCGTITSFPNIGQDNKLFEGLSLQEIDEEFQRIAPRYLPMPTGVGFCMAMNKKAIREVGVLDEESFGMGYGEENDWCQRAINKGYKNVHVENLFVYHKHGGSFLSEDKKQFLEKHTKILEAKHPDYNKQVARFFTVDQNKDIRKLVKYRLIRKGGASKTIVAFDHDLGGGATAYLNNQREAYVDEGHAFYVVRYNYIQNYYQILFYYGKEKIKFFVKKQDDIFVVLKFINAGELWINELATYPQLMNLLKKIQKYSSEQEIDVKMLVHDYFLVCPTINLINSRDRYCGIPDCDLCSECTQKNTAFEECGSIETWRSAWKGLLDVCKSIVVFSDDSKKIVEKTYGDLGRIEVIPHQIKYMPQIQKRYKMTKSFNIGLLGVLTKHKGAQIIKELCALIEKENLNIKVILIGNTTEKIESPVFVETGRYTRDSIPRLTLKHDIDIFLIPSIWPETFSYTTEEVMRMGMPVMCFNIGAPAERVSKYSKGIVIPQMSADAVLEGIKGKNMVQTCLKLPQKNKEVLFVAEEKSFASRYRIEHLREQLLHEGVASTRIMIGQAGSCDLNRYKSIVVYRASREKEIRKLVRRAHRLGKRVYYNMDDFIFEYERIKELEFLKGTDYKEFEQYSVRVKKSMTLCDGYIVSTNAMKSVVKESFPKKPVYVSRNVASMAMLICSLENQYEKKNDKIYLGYFSGTKTHDKDLESIQKQILTVMKENENVYLLIGGQIQLPEGFNCVKDRVERFKFLSWRKLPYWIAKADINLMPLGKTIFHNCKSENKWMEAALMHVPTVATWNSELECAIDNGVDGYLCKEDDEWSEILQKLISDVKLRNQIADAAFNKVMEKCTTFQMEQEVLEVLTK